MLGAVTDGSAMEALIVLDQFEQYFVYHPDQEEPFADEFCRALSSRDLQANFLVSIREDWLASLDRFIGRVPDFFDNSIRVEHLDRDSAKAAIRDPVSKYNEEIDKHRGEPDFFRQKVKIEDQFIEEALNQLAELDFNYEDLGTFVKTEPRERPIQASALQIVLQHVWNRVKNQPFPTLSKELLKPGSAKRIFRSHLHDSLKHLSFIEKLTVERVFPLLISSSGTKVAQSAEGLAEISGCKPRIVNRLLVKLTNNRILNEHGPLDPRAPLPLYEITSDVIANPIRNWLKVRRFRRRRIRQVSGLVVAAILVAVVAIWINNLVRENQHKARVQQRSLERAQKAKQWVDFRHRLAPSDKWTPYLELVLRGHEERLTSAVFISERQILTASADGSAMLWDVGSIDPIGVFGEDEPKPISAAAVSPDGNLIVTAYTDGTVSMWGRLGYIVSLRGVQLRGQVGKHLTSVSFSPDGYQIAATNTVGDLLLWNSIPGTLVLDMEGNGKPSRQISFSPSGKLLAMASDDATATVWRNGEWSNPTVFKGHSGKINGLAFSPDEKSLATASADATIRLWDLTTGESREFAGHTKSVNSVDFDTSGERMLSASDDGTARIWNVDNTPSIELKGHTDKVLSASFSPDGQQVVTGSRDETARIWLARTGELLIELRGHTDEVTYISYSKDGKYVLTASDDKTARVWLAPEGHFNIATPVIEIKKDYENYAGPCPVTIGFDVGITAEKGTGSVIYRFKGSDGRIWPAQELVFDKPSTKYLKWYWRITESTKGHETIEIIEPKNIEEQHARFNVTCVGPAQDSAPGTPTNPTAPVAPSPSPAAPSPTSSPSPSPPSRIR
jgi:WD40 repeat protein